MITPTAAPTSYDEGFKRGFLYGALSLGDMIAFAFALTLAISAVRHLP